MKTLILLICCFVLLIGCTAETQDEVPTLPPEPAAPGAVDAVLEGQVVVDNDDIAIEVVVDVVEVDVKGAMDEDAAYSFGQDGATSNTVLKGVVSYKGADWCQGYSETTV
jgi:hypothetical protein